MEVLFIIFGRTFFQLHNFTLLFDFFFVNLPFQPFPLPFTPVPPATDVRPLLKIQTVCLVGVETAAHELRRIDNVLKGFGRDFQRFLVKQ